MSRSNAPLALSVVTLTNPGDVETTLSNITAFDDRDFGFNHNQTWAAMPKALRGVLRPESVAGSFTKAPVRVQRCIVALCELGVREPRLTRSFADHPDAGLKTVESIDWDPEVQVKVKASCWYNLGTTPIIPVLQPRKRLLEEERLAVYVRLVRQAYCQGDWVDAAVELIDLSGDDDVVTARSLDVRALPSVSDALIARYVQTFVEAKKLADKQRAAREKKKADLPLIDIMDEIR